MTTKVCICQLCGNFFIKHRPSHKQKYCSRNCWKQSCIGRKHSEETKRKISEKNKISQKGRIPWNKGLNGYRKGYKQSEEHKEKIGLSNKGKKRSLEVRKKLSEAHKGKSSPKKGKRLSEESRIKISLALGGSGILSKINRGYSPQFNKKLKYSIFKRDNFICHICFKYGGDLVVHHIDYDKQNCNENNLITLHRSCHNKTHFNRDKWIKYFRSNKK